MITGFLVGVDIVVYFSNGSFLFFQNKKLENVHKKKNNKQNNRQQPTTTTTAAITSYDTCCTGQIRRHPSKMSVLAIIGTRIRA
jgi:hypothetical protein